MSTDLPLLALGEKLHGPLNEEIAGVSSDNVDRILASSCAKIRKARMPESRNTKTQNHQNKAWFTRTTKA